MTLTLFCQQKGLSSTIESMDSYQNPVTPPDPYERYRVGAGGKEKQEKEWRSGGEEESSEEKWGLAAYFLNVLKKIIDCFLEAPEKRNFRVEEKFVEHLKALKATFEILKREDRSEDIQFLNHLSQLWQCVLEDALGFKRDAELASQYKILIKKIQQFPENQLHTFGYYLSEYAGQKWIPFPYMEMIQKIHSEHAKNPIASALSGWTHLIDQLLLKAE